MFLFAMQGAAASDTQFGTGTGGTVRKPVYQKLFGDHARRPPFAGAENSNNDNRSAPLPSPLFLLEYLLRFSR